MKYHIKDKAMTVQHSDFYECVDCNEQHENYNDLYHPDNDTGGFCSNCRSDNIKTLEAYTVVHTLYATSPEDALETSLELDGCCQETTVFEGIISEKEN